MTPWIFRPKTIDCDGTFQPSATGHGVVVKLILFHPAGTGASIYNGWVDSLEEHLTDAGSTRPLLDSSLCARLEVYPIELPGRGMRRKEALLTNMHDVVAGATDAIMNSVFRDSKDGGSGGTSTKTKIVVFGHSLGGWIAFEVVRELERRCDASQRRDLLCLIVSAIRSPTLSGVENDIDAIAMHTLEEDAFWEVMERRYGKNAELEHPSIRKFMYPVLKADFTISETYSFSLNGDTPLLSLPLFVSGATNDVRYTEEMLSKWSLCTQSDIFEERMFKGGHSYLFTKDESCKEHCTFVLQCVSLCLEDHVKAMSDGESTMCHPPGTTTMSITSFEDDVGDDGSVMTATTTTTTAKNNYDRQAKKHEEDLKEEQERPRSSSCASACAII